ncbi:alpha/beta hydrolase fold domain-containing protein [Bradyrhizobium sp. JYMT SZCCT0428]|uniref:alpha/beta hydrolase fold domain-containing protein n=1 Tax=Bradyrhizobium sp. JYMT SZCCT0428 TaxID=2807673 RepID=UPI001BA88EFB|nr:alpha/beta hydrolase fold domain-containing protein [Bradyrhizobium sp. JYMT SZCCT0428]MBR1155195.1 alpha/beta hydrolase fold domain-containing protein [Bradyrhizobium sp. JYMT SZCCT0428]
MDAIALVDGTGRWWNKDYEQDMARSFCSQIAKLFRGNPNYRRGPSDEGYRFNEKAAEAVDLLHVARGLGATRLFLAGYSRGAAIALEAAEQLSIRNVQVDGLFLFDPVTRAPTRGSVCAKSIPQNVRFSRTASRSLDQALVKKYEGVLPMKPYNLAALPALRGNPIRPEFGTFTVSPCGTGDHQSKTFKGSHGALGGVGWADVGEDENCQHEVASWMNEAFISLSLGMKIQAPPLTARF